MPNLKTRLLFTVLMLADGLLAAEPLPRWSVATNWTDGWPSDWGHAEAARTETSGQWTIHHGELRLPGGTLKLRDAERVSHLAAGVTEVRRRWEWTGDVPLDQVTLSVRRQIAMQDARPFVPGISYPGKVPLNDWRGLEQAFGDRNGQPVAFDSRLWENRPFVETRWSPQR